MKNIFLNVSVLVSISLLPIHSFAASFDCAKATSATEKLICSEDNISKLDEQLASSYKQALESATDKDAIKKAQVEWLKQQRSCKDAGCLTQTYQTRIAELNNSSTIFVQKNSSINGNKNPPTFKFISGDSYPMCKPYLDMLQATKYIEYPTCERKILPNFPQFKKIDWVEITDKNEIKKIVEERLRINVVLRKSDGDDTLHNAKTMSKIVSGELKMYFHKMDVNKDGLEDFIYKTTESYKDASTYQMCADYNFYYIAISGMDVNSAKKYKYDPYAAFNFAGNNDLFVFGDELYSSNWTGNEINKGINLELYSVWSKSICGFYVN